MTAVTLLASVLALCLVGAVYVALSWLLDVVGAVEDCFDGKIR